MEIYFITGNNNKFKKIANYIHGLKKMVVEGLPEIQSLDINEVIEKKLFAAVEHYSGDDAKFMVEDTGLYLKALNNFPGPLIKFLLERIGNEGIYNLCSKIGNFEAYAITVFGLIESSTKTIEYFKGTVNGTISKPAGKYGFGWDQIFIPERTEKTFAQMETIEEKNSYSMRVKALRKLLKQFESNK